MSKTKHILGLANSIDKKLPSDGYASIDEWIKRYKEQLRDMGYADHQIDDLMRDTRRSAELREEAKTRLAQMLQAKTGPKTGPLPLHMVESAKQFVLHMLKDRGHFIGMPVHRDWARYAKHITYFSKRSAKIRNAYVNVFDMLRKQNNEYLIYVLGTMQPDQADALGKYFGYRFWRMDASETFAFHPSDTFLTCPKTKLEFPSSRGLAAVIDEDGRTARFHPNVAATDYVARDISGTIVVRNAVQWVTLESGDLAWRRHNEARGTIYQEDNGTWVRGATDGRVASYHGAPRNWRKLAERDPAAFKNAIGVELECGFKTTGHLTKFISRFVEANGRFISNRPFCIENDSSLTGITGGVEIISEPLPLYQGYQAPDADWRWLLDKLVTGGAEGWKNRAKAGIHVNMDVHGRTPNHILRFVAFVHNAAAIAKFISGRRKIFGASGGDDSADTADYTDLDKFIAFNKGNHYNGGFELITPDRFKAITNESTFSRDAMSTFRQRGKYQPVHIRQNAVLEVRIFGSNIRYEGFMACVEFCVGGMEFACSLEKDTDVLDADIGTKFRMWLTESDHAAKYPNLVSRLGTRLFETTPSTVKAAVALPLADITA